LELHAVKLRRPFSPANVYTRSVDPLRFACLPHKALRPYGTPFHD
jgi:hypothetical protein